jgi:RND superfamily putative drug exporter
VRSVLVPALMLIVGDANWKLPRALARVLPHLRVEGASAAVDGSRSPAIAPAPVAGS